MYLEPIQSFGAAGCPVGQKLVPYTATNKYGQVVEASSICLRDPDYVKPTPVPSTPSIALFSYDLTGTATGWRYASCKTGYTKKLSGKPHPNYYTCFKR